MKKQKKSEKMVTVSKKCLNRSAILIQILAAAEAASVTTMVLDRFMDGAITRKISERVDAIKARRETSKVVFNTVNSVCQSTHKINKKAEEILSSAPSVSMGEMEHWHEEVSEIVDPDAPTNPNLSPDGEDLTLTAEELAEYASRPEFEGFSDAQIQEVFNVAGILSPNDLHKKIEGIRKANEKLKGKGPAVE